MIYKLEREFLEFEKWCCAVTSDNSMLFAINTNREFFVLNQDVERSQMYCIIMGKELSSMV